MKFLYRISLFFLVASAFFYIGVVVMTMQQEKSGKGEEQTTEYGREIQSDGNYSAENISQNDTAPVMEENGNKVTASTEYILRTMQKENHDIQEQIQPVPVNYIGLTREGLEEEIMAYACSPTLEDQEKGFLSISLESFSPTRIMITKTYHKTEPKSEAYFFLVAEDHKVTVYRSDQKTIYMKTDISMDTLPEEIQNEILDTKCLQGEAELYNFLESYSS